MSTGDPQQYASWLKQIRKRELSAALGVVRGKQFNSVLELGCGDGYQSEELRMRFGRVVSSDYRVSALDREEGHELVFVACDAEQLPFKDESFDLIFTSNLLEHLEDVGQALTEMKRTLRREGVMIHTVPNITWKLLQLLLHYPFVFSLALAKCIKRHHRGNSELHRAKYKRADSNVKRTGAVGGGWGRKWKSRLFPSIHGVSQTHIEEMYRFSNYYWTKVFKANGLSIRPCPVRMPLYSAYGFGLESLRKIGERIGLSSAYCFLVSQTIDSRDASCIKEMDK
ncbi:class I SAM-dependent methyltransferase [Candidatus Nitrospira bockiana]